MSPTTLTLSPIRFASTAMQHPFSAPIRGPIRQLWDGVRGQNLSALLEESDDGDEFYGSIEPNQSYRYHRDDLSAYGIPHEMWVA